MNPETQQRCYTQSIQSGCYVVEDDTPALRQSLKAADGEGLGDVEKAKEDECDEAVTPVGGAEEERDPLAGYFIDDDEAGVVAAALAGGDGGGGDAEDDGENNSGEKQDQQYLGRAVEADTRGGPEEYGGY